MSYKLLGGGSDLNTVISDVNQNILELKVREQTEIFKDATGQRRVMLGQGANGFYGLKVSKPGFDVYTATDDQLVFNSSQNTFKIALSGTKTQAISSIAAGTTTTITIPHGLSAPPATICYVNLPNLGTTYYSTNGLTQLPTQVMFQDSLGFGNILVFVTTRVDDTNFYIDIINPTTGTVGSGQTWTFKYYILQETASGA